MQSITLLRGESVPATQTDDGRRLIAALLDQPYPTVSECTHG